MSVLQHRQSSAFDGMLQQFTDVLSDFTGLHSENLITDGFQQTLCHESLFLTRHVVYNMLHKVVCREILTHSVVDRIGWYSLLIYPRIDCRV